MKLVYASYSSIITVDETDDIIHYLNYFFFISTKTIDSCKLKIHYLSQKTLIKYRKKITLIM